MEFTYDIINRIQILSKKCIKKYHKGELIFFDDIWEIYETELRKWINKPQKRWKLKIPKSKYKTFLGMTDSSQAPKLATFKFVDVISNSFSLVAFLKEYSLQKIREIIISHGKKMHLKIKVETINYLAELYLQSLGELEQITKEKDLKEELEIYTHIGKYEYIMYTNEDTEGTQLTEDDYNDFLEDYQKKASEYRFIINEVKYECFFNGTKIEGKNKPVTPAWRALIFLLLKEKKQGATVNYKDVFNFVWPGKIFDYNYKTVERWISFFRGYFDNKMQWFIVGHKPEFVFQEDVNFKFCIFRRLKNISD